MVTELQRGELRDGGSLGLPSSRRGVEAMEVEISTERSRLDFEFVHGYLAKTYWSTGLPAEILKRAIKNSLCFGAYSEGRQVGFARVISDYATFAYLCDVFVDPSCTRRGIGKKLMTAIMAHSSLQGLRRFSLATRDAHGLYESFGFQSPQKPETLMEILQSDMYRARD